MDEIFCEPYRAMVICPDLLSQKLHDVITWIKAPADQNNWKMEYIIIADTNKTEQNNTGGPLSHLKTI